MKIEGEIDRLYQLPLGEFTSARNALVKQLRGADASRVRQLAKPNIPAWGVNQLYWRNRRLYDRVVDAMERSRSAHHAMLSGKSVDLQKAESAHREAVRAAAAEIRDMLGKAGETASPATMTAVNETLEALPPPDDQPGRLTRPLKRMGFEALAGVVPGAARPRNLKLVSSREPAASAKATAVKKAEPSPAKQRKIETVEEKLRTLRAEERQGQTHLEHARRTLERAEQDQARAEREFDEATEKVKSLRADIARREKQQQATSADRERLEATLAKLTEE